MTIRDSGGRVELLTEWRGVLWRAADSVARYVEFHGPTLSWDRFCHCLTVEPQFELFHFVIFYLPFLKRATAPRCFLSVKTGIYFCFKSD